MKKIIVGGVLLLLVVLLYFIFSSSKSETVKKNISKSLLTQKVEPQKEKEAFPLLEVEDEVEEDLTLALAPIELNTPKERVPEMVEDEVVDIMVETTMDEVSKNFPPKEGVKPVTAINLPQHVIANLKIGDTVSLPNMGNGEFNAKITSKKRHKSGSVTVTGNLVDYGDDYSVVLTEGKKMSFGTVTTPNGSYEIEARDGQGYVYSTEAIDSARIDDSKEDFLIPNI